MRIAQLVESDSPGGTERLVLQIVAELTRRGHEVVTVGPTDTGWLGEELRARGHRWESIVRRFMFDPRAVLDLVRICRHYRIQAVHAHEFAPSVFGAAAARLTGASHVITMHSNPYYAVKWRRRVAFGLAQRSASGVAAVSADTAADAERVLKLPPGTIVTIPNGIVSVSGDRREVRRELGVRDDELLVVAIGNLSERKAHHLLVRALIQLKERSPEIRWRLAIGGTDQGTAPHLRDLAADGKVAERVHLLGHRSDTENVLAAADVFAMCSLHEGMPLAIMEAMFAGLPVVSSTAGGIGEMITDGVDGLLVPVGISEPLAQALERLLTDPSLRGRLGAAARERAARQFGIAPMMDAYERLYRGESTA
jgi:glycosyltransferase involved in cell wall biosynthesis